MDRKDFFKNCMRLAGAGILIPLLGQSCKGIAYISLSTDSNGVLVKKADLTDHPFVLIQPANLPAPIFLTKLDNTHSVPQQFRNKLCEFLNGYLKK